MNGQDVRSAREELGWTRKQLVEQLAPIAEGMGHPAMTISHLAVVEQRKREPHFHEIEQLRKLFLGALGRVITEEVPVVPVDADGTPTASVTVTHQGATRSMEWNGFRHGDIVRVRGLGGRFKFLYHHVDPGQEYVEVSGPIVRIFGRSLGKAQHSFTPDRIFR